MTDWVIIQTGAFNEIYSLLEKAQLTCGMYAIVSHTGCGKTLTITNYLKDHENVYYYKLEKTWKPKTLYIKILESLGIWDYNGTVDLNSLAYKVQSILNANRNGKSLLIFDEAGKFSADMLEYFQSIRDATEEHVGIVLLGTPPFQRKFSNWVAQNYQGIPELDSRIYSWIEVNPPTTNEKYQIAKRNGVTDPIKIKEIVKESSDLRKLYQKVMEYRFQSKKGQ